MSTSQHARERGFVGPNAVIQLGQTLIAHGETGLAERIYFAAGHPEWLREPPEAMTPQAEVAALHDALHRLASAGRARIYAAEAGRRTGDYIIANRIPPLARALLRVLPGPSAARLLMKAIARHAWTFAGTGRFVCGPGSRAFAIESNPLARRGGCVWHEAVLTRLFQELAHPGILVRETSCCANGDSACRFELTAR